MMRLAVIGAPGAGKTTLVHAVCGLLGVQPIRSFAELEARRDEETLVLDGVLETITDLDRYRAVMGDEPPDHVLELIVDLDVRARRIARLVSEGADAPMERARLLSPDGAVQLEKLRIQLVTETLVTSIDANRSRSEVLERALEVLGLHG